MKRTKKITRVLLAIAKTLPEQKYQSRGQQEQSGFDLIKQGIKEDGDKKPIKPDQKYERSIPLENSVNHFNRMKSAFDANGKIGVKHYLKPLLKPELEAEFFANLDTVL
jgi:hypothetical protein